MRVILASVLHAGLGVGGHAGLNAWAMGFLDGGGREPGFAFTAARALVDYVLLQPFAHWVLVQGDVAWWTWPGLGLTALVVLANSFVQVSLVVALWRMRRGT